MQLSKLFGSKKITQITPLDSIPEEARLGEVRLLRVQALKAEARFLESPSAFATTRFGVKAMETPCEKDRQKFGQRSVLLPRFLLSALRLQK